MIDKLYNTILNELSYYINNKSKIKLEKTCKKIFIDLINA